MKSKIKKTPVVGIIMGSDSDWETMEAAASTLKRFGIDHEVEVVSAHRTPVRMVEYSQTAYERGLKVIIAGAGGAAHLPGMVASLTILPVIGVPVSSKNLNGLDSLLSIVQMPRGIPVATVAIGNAENAALLALRILATNDKKLAVKLVDEEKELVKKVALMNTKIKSRKT
jgi:5-(carboxyamino)imidazole ribonucleotide mutase